ncbi:MAG: S49 family peptidase [Aureliella sp.]
MRGDMRMSGKMDMSGDMTTTMRTDNQASRLASVPVYSSGTGACQSGKVAVIDVDGLLVNKNISGIGSMGENPVALFREKLDVVATDPSVAAIVLRMNSPGGGVTASDIMLRDLTQLKQQRGIPVVACMMDVATGGTYYVASAADAIVAHPTSIMGGLGVILNVYNMELTLSQFNIAAIHVKSGDRVDIASPERMMEQGERDLLQGMADSFHDRMINQITNMRPEVKQHSEAAFDGRVFTGDQAHQMELVDQVGYLDDAVSLARQLAGLPDQSPVVMLRRDNDRAYTLLDVTPNTPTMGSLLPLKVPGLDRANLPTFLYLWQPEPTLGSAAGS